MIQDQMDGRSLDAIREWLRDQFSLTNRPLCCINTASGTLEPVPFRLTLPRLEGKER